MPPPSSSPPARQSPPGAPSLYGTVLLSQGDTGQPVALLEGNTLTALRTGAIGGLAAKHLAREDAATLSLVGCGVQGLHQLTFLCQVRPIPHRLPVQPRQQGPGALLPKRQLEAMVAPKPLAIELCPDPDTLLAKSDIVVTATPAKAPLFADDPAPFRASASSPSAPGSRTCGRFPRPSGRPPGRSFWSSPSPARRAATCASPSPAPLKPEGLRYFGTTFWPSRWRCAALPPHPVL